MVEVPIGNVMGSSFLKQELKSTDIKINMKDECFNFIIYSLVAKTANVPQKPA